MNKLLVEVQDVISEVQGSKLVINSIFSLLDDVSKTFPSLFEKFLVSIVETSFSGFSSIYLLNPQAVYFLSSIHYLKLIGFLSSHDLTVKCYSLL